MRFSCAIMMIALFFLSGCTTFKVEDIDGIKSMLNRKIDAEYLASKVQTEHTGSDKDKIMELYRVACLENNKWIAGIKLDIQLKDKLKVSEKDYNDSPAGLASAQFISISNSARYKTIGLIGEVAAQIVYNVIENINEQNNKKAEEARKRIYKELEKAEWKELPSNKSLQR